MLHDLKGFGCSLFCFFVLVVVCLFCCVSLFVDAQHYFFFF